MTLKICAFFLFLLGSFIPSARANHIAAVVGDEIITMTDLHNRIKMIHLLFNNAGTPEAQKKLEPQVLEIMVNEHIQLHAAKKYKIKLSDKKIAKSLENFTQQRGTTPEKLKAAMKQNGIPYALLENQLKASLVMNMIVQDLHGNMLHLSDDEVDRKYEAVQKEQGNRFEHFVTLHQIAIPLPEKPTEEDAQFAFGRLETLLANVGNEKSFLNIKKENPDIQLQSMVDLDYDALHPQLLDILKTMRVGKVSDPMMTPYGATVLFWAKDEKKKITVSRDQVMDMLYAQKMDKATKLALKNLKRDVYVDLRV